MNTARELDRALDRLADAWAGYAMARVEQALGMERDRHDAEIAELRDEILQLGEKLHATILISDRVAKVVSGIVKVEP